MARKVEEEDKAGAGLLVMMVSLNLILLIFFIYLNSIGTDDGKKIKKALGSLAGRFGILEGGLQLSPGKTILLPGAPIVSHGDDATSVADAFRKMAKEEGVAEEVEMTQEGSNLVINLSEKVLFPSGSSDLRPASDTILRKVSLIIEKSSLPIRVEGHTDDLPISTPKFPSNWELSAARAASVLRYFSEKGGIPGRRMTAIGYAATRPKVANDGPVNRSRNRRVNVVLMKGG